MVEITEISAALKALALGGYLSRLIKKSGSKAETPDHL